MLRREGGKFLLAYVKGVDPYLIHIDRPTTIRSPEHISGWVNERILLHILQMRARQCLFDSLSASALSGLTAACGQLSLRFHNICVKVVLFC